MGEERNMSEERLVAALAALGPEIAYPPTPALVPAVTARLSAPQARRPVAPGRARWTRRRMLVLVAAGVLAALAIAAAARLAIGAFEVREQPASTPSPSQSPVEPGVLGEPVAPEGTRPRPRGFEPALPEGTAARRALRGRQSVRRPGAPVRVDAERDLPPDPGSEWGMVLMAFQGDAETVIKYVERFEDVEGTSVEGRSAYWVDARTWSRSRPRPGSRRSPCGGNVLVWEGEDGISYRMETALGLVEALELASSATR